MVLTVLQKHPAAGTAKPSTSRPHDQGYSGRHGATPPCALARDGDREQPQQPAVVHEVVRAQEVLRFYWSDQPNARLRVFPGMPVP